MDIDLILAKKYAGVSWSINAGDYDQLNWLDSSSKPKKAALEALWPEVQSEVKWDAVRADRNKLLDESDWTQVADVPLDAAKKTAWTTYRQALRDLPQEQNNPDNITWPKKPE